MRIGLCQIDPTVGDLQGNADRVLAAARRAREQGAELAVFPELAICGYPPRDLLERERFVHQQREALERVARDAPAGLTSLVGFVDRIDRGAGRQLHNAAAVVRDGRVEHVVHKRLLPTYDVFDEERYFEPGQPGRPIAVGECTLGITICEDIWNDADTPIAPRRYEDNPVGDLRRDGADLIVNLSASPFTTAKRHGRGDMLSAIARRHGVAVVFVNQVGGNDDLIFDGASAIYGPDGSTWARLARFREDLAVVDLAPGGPIVAEEDSEEATALEALTLGVRDYARKCGFSGALIGLSGGIDSALTACVAVRALGAESVLGVAMPTRFSSAGSQADSEALARALGIEYRVVSIDRLFQHYIDELTPHLDALREPFPGDVTFENIQARIRGNVLMGMSNRTGLLLLSTGNKSEIAVGYTTLYGDMAGGLAVISDVPKTFVYALAREVNRQAGHEVVPESTLNKPPSAELRDNQTDQDSLPPYEVIDPILERFVEEGQSVDAIIEAGFDPDVVQRVTRMVRLNEYKRRQLPPGLILTRKAFGPGRRYPIAQGYVG
ncbi:MAG: NAD+ synthase [Myxococcota bacterium]